MEELKLSDETISHIAKILQLALLTGTDIVDNMRTIRLALSEENSLVPHPSYADRFTRSVEDMMTEETKATLKAALETSSEFLTDGIDSDPNEAAHNLQNNTLSFGVDTQDTNQSAEGNETSASEDVDEW